MKADLILININEYADPAVCDTFLKTLDPDRIKKTLSYKYADDRKRSLIAGLLIRYFLEINGKGPDDLKYNENGKPYFEGAYFNVSHSGSYVAAIYSTQADVACDIEQVRKCRENIVSRYFSDREKAYLESGDAGGGTGNEDADFEKWPGPGDRAKTACSESNGDENGETAGSAYQKIRDIKFTEIWTKKESYVKLKGERIAAIIRDTDTYDPGCSFKTWLHDGHIITVCAAGSISITRKNISFPESTARRYRE